MIVARLVSVALTLGAIAVLWVLWGDRATFRAPLIWELRYVIALVVAVLVLSLAEWFSAKMAALMSKGTPPA